MKIAVVFLAVLVISVSAVEQYTNKFDNIDLDQILSNQRLRTNYVNCLLKDSPCTPEGKELKRILPDAIETECAKCNEKQKSGAEKVIKFLSKNDNESWQKILDKYDSKGVYRAKYADKAKEEGVAI